MIDESTARRVAGELVAARAERRTIEPLTARMGLTMDDAYRIQEFVTALRLQRGERVVGWKLGYTSAAMREQMGVEQPNFGPLTDVMVLPNGASAGAHLTHPRVEPEIALVLARPLSGAGVTRGDVMAALGRAVASLEVVDSVYTDYRFRIEDNTADGSSAAQVVLGADLPSGVDLAALEVVLEHNGQGVATATGAAAMGHPAEGVAWLARRQPLAAGELVITGGLTAAVPLRPGDVCAARFGSDAAVTVHGPA